MSEPDAWARLREFTQARIALGRAGDGLPTARVLEFELAHARAQDAVHAALDVDRLADALAAFDPIVVASEAATREEYLQRPDRGRRLDPRARERLRSLSSPASRSAATAREGRGVIPGEPPVSEAREGDPSIPLSGFPSPRAPLSRSAGNDTVFDVAIVVADGLSARAVQASAPELAARLRALLPTLRFAPLVIVVHGRVAVGDEVAAALGAALVVVLIGERPGLSAPDSLGAYLTFAPRPGVTPDAERNCVSNIRPAGLSIEAAAKRIAALIGMARRIGLSGVALKEDDALALFAAERGTLPSR